MSKQHIIIITPALAKANNGNALTASRWAFFLRKHYRVTVALQWDGSPCDLMIAMHARRSARSIVAFATAFPASPLQLALTGTDLYRDIRIDADAQRSLQLATQLLVLQPKGLNELSADLRRKTEVIYQSAPSLKPICQHSKQQRRYFDVVMIGHLRDEKDPVTFMQAVAHVKTARVRMLHIGAALDVALGEQAMLTQGEHRHYRWLGHVSHAKTR